MVDRIKNWFNVEYDVHILAKRWQVLLACAVPVFVIFGILL